MSISFAQKDIDIAALVACWSFAGKQQFVVADSDPVNRVARSRALASEVQDITLTA
jgi:hypothetical protein